MNYRNNVELDDKQRKLADNNYRLAIAYIHKILARGIIPQRYIQDFISEINYRLCISAYYFDVDLGYRFYTFAHGGFKHGLRNIIDKIENERISLVDIEWLEVGQDNLLKNVTNKITIDDLIKRGHLTRIEKDILLNRYIGGLSFDELGNRHKCSREKARYVLEKALEKTRKC